MRYLRIEGAFYCGIGCLFLLYFKIRKSKLLPLENTLQLALAVSDVKLIADLAED